MTDYPTTAMGTTVYDDDDEEDIFGHAVFHAQRHLEIIRRDRPEYYRQLQREWEEKR
ncbi:MAG TPA: hypothetical protein PKJ56_08305 [Promineifilum sp.]|nr:hypothetical protein [Promineifilum sp.]